MRETDEFSLTHYVLEEEWERGGLTLRAKIRERGIGKGKRFRENEVNDNQRLIRREETLKALGMEWNHDKIIETCWRKWLTRIVFTLTKEIDLKFLLNWVNCDEKIRSFRGDELFFSSRCDTDVVLQIYTEKSMKRLLEKRIRLKKERN